MKVLEIINQKHPDIVSIGDRVLHVLGAEGVVTGFCVGMEGVLHIEVEFIDGDVFTYHPSNIRE